MDQSFVIVVGIVVAFALAGFALRAVREPRPLRAEVARDLEGFPSIGKHVDVPPRARAFGRFSEALRGRMLALNTRSHPSTTTSSKSSCPIVLRLASRCARAREER